MLRAPASWVITEPHLPRYARNRTPVSPREANYAVLVGDLRYHLHHLHGLPLSLSSADTCWATGLLKMGSCGRSLASRAPITDLIFHFSFARFRRVTLTLLRSREGFVRARGRDSTRIRRRNAATIAPN